MLCGNDLGGHSTMTDHIWVKNRTFVLNVGEHMFRVKTSQNVCDPIWAKSLFNIQWAE